MSKKRMEGLDLLRIVSMLLIVMIHALTHGGGLETVGQGTAEYWRVYILYAVTMTANNCYVLISGYFLCDIKNDSKQRVKKAAVLILKTVFYSTGIYFVLHIAGLCAEPRHGNLSMVMPVIHDQYWFITKYIGMYAIFPFLNTGIQAMSRKEHLSCIGIMCILYSVIPTAFCVTGWLGNQGEFSVTWFVLLYLIAAYFRRYYPETKFQSKAIPLYVISVLLIPCSKFLIPYISKLPLLYFLDADIFYSSASPLALVASVSIFLWFRDIKIECSVVGGIIRNIARCTMGIYLIHNHQDLKILIWSYAGLRDYSGNFFTLYIIVMSVAIFFICMLMELGVQTIKDIGMRLFYMRDKKN